MYVKMHMGVLYTEILAQASQLRVKSDPIRSQEHNYYGKALFSSDAFGKYFRIEPEDTDFKGLSVRISCSGRPLKLKHSYLASSLYLQNIHSRKTICMFVCTRQSALGK